MPKTPESEAENLRLIARVLEVCDGHGGPASDELMFTTKDGVVRVLANCGDVFDWGSADCDEITVANVAVLEQARVDLRRLDPIYQTQSLILFCARVREERPQNAFYEGLKTEYWPIFDECGPERPVCFFNPKKRSELTKER